MPIMAVFHSQNIAHCLLNGLLLENDGFLRLIAKLIMTNKRFNCLNEEREMTTIELLLDAKVTLQENLINIQKEEISVLKESIQMLKEEIAILKDSLQKRTNVKSLYNSKENQQYGVFINGKLYEKFNSVSEAQEHGQRNTIVLDNWHVRKIDSDENIIE